MTTAITTKHTAEPWHIDTEHPTEIRGVQGEASTMVAEVRSPYLSEQIYPNAARIVACVNACAGVEDPASAIALAKTGLSEAEKCARQRGEFSLADCYYEALRALGG